MPQYNDICDVDTLNSEEIIPKVFQTPQSSAERLKKHFRKKILRTKQFDSPIPEQQNICADLDHLFGSLPAQDTVYEGQAFPQATKEQLRERRKLLFVNRAPVSSHYSVDTLAASDPDFVPPAKLPSMLKLNVPVSAHPRRIVSDSAARKPRPTETSTPRKLSISNTPDTSTFSEFIDDFMASQRFLDTTKHIQHISPKPRHVSQPQTVRLPADDSAPTTAAYRHNSLNVPKTRNVSIPAHQKCNSLPAPRVTKIIYTSPPEQSTPESAPASTTVSRHVSVPTSAPTISSKEQSQAIINLSKAFAWMTKMKPKSKPKAELAEDKSLLAVAVNIYTSVILEYCPPLHAPFDIIGETETYLRAAMVGIELSAVIYGLYEVAGIIQYICWLVRTVCIPIVFLFQLVFALISI
ncbi:hypothetical protein CANCADRAFT_45047 [Tortispora caseinolytica NRRL Y-17796]|uniref:Uncharacterized protein n=1 Tax=Tortispora caseinolytica NRRL Y-17796 TaxID=767744 RepID=A0A1E4T9Z9_9ASCO|nr:hypothetical protein CANCADRAFT_45047 [Tortispora caseinolytica NRRL Y-17796]